MTTNNNQTTKSTKSRTIHFIEISFIFLVCVHIALAGVAFYTGDNETGLKEVFSGLMNILIYLMLRIIRAKDDTINILASENHRLIKEMDDYKLELMKEVQEFKHGMRI
jgi:hypothetical protein